MAGVGVFFDRCSPYIYFSFKMTTETILRWHCQYVSKPVRDVKVLTLGVGEALVDQTSDSPSISLCHHMRGNCAQ